MRIKQCLTSNSIRFFEKSFCQKWNLNPYTDQDKPAVFFGAYCDRDYLAIINHRALAVVVWGGSDSMKSPEKLRWLKLPHIRHISGSKWISDDLDRAGLDSINVPISCVDSDKIRIRPFPLGRRVYIYTSATQPEFYGSEIYIRLMREYGPNMFYLATHKTYNQAKLYNLILPDSFIGLRLVNHDGLSETVSELGLMGRRVVYNGAEPNALNYESYEDVRNHINAERKKVGISNVQLAVKMKKFLDIGSGWLMTENY